LKHRFSHDRELLNIHTGGLKMTSRGGRTESPPHKLQIRQ